MVASMRCAALVVVVVALAGSAFGQAPPPPPFSLDLTWSEAPTSPKSSAPATTEVRWHVWGRTVTRSESAVASTASATQATSTTFELTGPELDAVIAAVPAYRKDAPPIVLPVNPKATAALSASIVVNTYTLVLRGDVPVTTPHPEFAGFSTMRAVLERAYAKHLTTTSPPAPAAQKPAPTTPPR